MPRPYSNTRTNRAQSKSFLGKTLFFLGLCLIFILSPAEALVTQPVQAADDTYLFDKVITWADGSTEHVQIGNDGYFSLDGAKTKLVGMTLSHDEMPFSPLGWCEIWKPGNLAVYDRELAYLHSIGVRLVTMWFGNYSQNPPGISAMADQYGPVLDLIYKHKMLLIPHLSLKWEPEFNNLVDPNWVMRGDAGRVSDFVNYWSDFFTHYPNVVTVLAENELDNPLSTTWDENVLTDQTYGAPEVAAYLDILTTIMRTKLGVPVLHNLVGTDLRQPEIKKVSLAKTDLPAFTFYPKSLAGLNAMGTQLTGWLGEVGYPTRGWWAAELNTEPESVNSLTPEYISALFNQGAATVMLWTTNASLFPNLGFFNNEGSPLPKLVKIAQEIPRLQAPMSTPATVTQGPNLTVLYPNGNEALRAGDRQTIKWTFSGVTGYVKIELVKADITKIITSRAPVGNAGSGSYIWNIPATQQPGSDYEVRITSLANPVLADSSDSNFTIARPVLPPTLKAPNSGATVSSLTPRLEWSPSTGATSYGVQVSNTSSFNTLLLNTVGVADTFYEIPNGALNWNTNYYWRLVAYDSYGASKWSMARSFKTAAGPPPSVPSGLTATATSSSNINLTWEDNSDNETGFRIERKTGASSAYFRIAQVGLNVQKYSDIGRLANTTYYYRVSAYNTVGSSGPSNETSVTTPK